MTNHKEVSNVLQCKSMSLSLSRTIRHKLLHSLFDRNIDGMDCYFTIRRCYPTPEAGDHVAGGQSSS